MPMREPSILLIKIHTEPIILLIVLPSFPREIMWQLLTSTAFLIWFSHSVLVPVAIARHSSLLLILLRLLLPIKWCSGIWATFKGLCNVPVQFSPSPCPFHVSQPEWVTAVLCGKWQRRYIIPEGSIHKAHKATALDESIGSHLWGLYSNLRFHHLLSVRPQQIY